jgi:hypothetical protein
MSFNYKKEHANIVNTPTWVKLNDDSYSKRHRKIFTDTYGGTFDNVNGGYIWKEIVQHTLKEPKLKKTGNFIVTFPDGKEEMVENMTKFCQKNNLNKSALYAIIRGERKKHKGFKIRRGI